MELLVVIGIIAILMGMLMPALSRAKQKGNRIACVNNIRQIGMAATMYAGDHDGEYPRRAHMTKPKLCRRQVPCFGSKRRRAAN